MKCILKKFAFSLIRSQSFILQYSNYLMFLIFSTPYRFLHAELIKLKRSKNGISWK